jgi:hypothetical protein
MIMNSYLRGLLVYFESVIHPAAGWAENKGEKKRKPKSGSNFQPSPECYNIRAASKKGDKMRRNPAP